MNKENIFTFWQGWLPLYLGICLNTWNFPYTILNYENLHEYTDFKVTPEMKLNYTLPQIADCVRVHVLRDNGGYWLDVDTIMLSNKLPKTNMIGNSEKRENTIGYLYTKPHSQMFEEWAAYQDEVIKRHSKNTSWDLFGNAFTDKYVKEHKDITISSVQSSWPETYMIFGNQPRFKKYTQFYFYDNYKLKDLEPTNMLMLHNSWTPEWYKRLSYHEIINTKCTLSNILREVTS